MIVRGTGFDDEMVKLFIERLCDTFGSPWDVEKIMNDFAYDGDDFDVLGKKEVERLERDNKYFVEECKSLRESIEYLRNNCNKERKINKNLIRESAKLEHENNEYAKDILHYEKTLSRLRLEEFKR